MRFLSSRHATGVPKGQKRRFLPIFWPKAYNLGAISTGTRVDLTFFKLWACRQDNADIRGEILVSVQAKEIFLVLSQRRATYWKNGQKERFLVISFSTGTEPRVFLHGRGASFGFFQSFWHVEKTWQIFVARFSCRCEPSKRGKIYVFQIQKSDPPFCEKKITFGWKFAPMGGIGLFNILTRKQDQVPMVS